jgi:hypothetical protein
MTLPLLLFSGTVFSLYFQNGRENQFWVHIPVINHSNNGIIRIQVMSAILWVVTLVGAIATRYDCHVSFSLSYYSQLHRNGSQYHFVLWLVLIVRVLTYNSDGFLKDIRIFFQYHPLLFFHIYVYL